MRNRCCAPPAPVVTASAAFDPYSYRGQGQPKHLFDRVPAEPAEIVEDPARPPRPVKKLSRREELWLRAALFSAGFTAQLRGGAENARRHPGAALLSGMGLLTVGGTVAAAIMSVHQGPPTQQRPQARGPASPPESREPPDVPPHGLRASPTPTPAPPPPTVPLLVTPEQLREIMPQLSVEKSVVWASALSQAMQRFGITTPRQKEAFLAEIAWESGELKFQREINPSPRFGNYYGRGPFQLTWEGNYQKESEELNLGNLLVAQPDLVATDPVIGADTAGLYWADNHLNQALASGGLYLVTHIINGGESGEAGRLQYYFRAEQVLGA